MIFEFVIVFQVIAFTFLALGIMPFKKSDEAGNLPLANKAIFLFISAILFFSLAILSVNISYIHCDSTFIEVSNTSQTITNECVSSGFNDPSVTYLNWGMGFLSVVLSLLVLLLGAFSRNDAHYPKDED